MAAHASRAQKQKWVSLYEKAAAATDDRARLHLIALAKGAIFERRRELAHSGKPHANVDELAELDDASYVLTALRKAAEFNRSR